MLCFVGFVLTQVFITVRVIRNVILCKFSDCYFEPLIDDSYYFFRLTYFTPEMDENFPNILQFAELNFAMTSKNENFVTAFLNKQF